MRTLSHIEMDLLLDFFEESPGYVLDFTDWSFNEFTDREIGVRVKDLYQGERLSKHKALSRFCKTPGNEEKAYKLMTALMNYFDLKLRDQYQFNEQGEKSYVKCKEILRAFAPIDAGKTQTGLAEMSGKLRALYSDGAMFQLTSGEDKISIGLSHLTAFIEAAIRCREWRIFGNPLVIHVLTDLAKLGGGSIRPAETKIAEGAWRDFSTKLNALLLLISKNEKVKDMAIYFRRWLSLRPNITEKVGGYDFYRGISTTVLTELIENFKRMAVASHPQYKDNLELMYCGVFNDEWDAYDFLPVDGAAIQLPQINLANPPGTTTDVQYAQQRDDSVIDKIDAISSKLDSMQTGIKRGFREVHDMHRKIDPNFRYHGVDKAGNLSKQTQIRAAINCSWDEQFEIARPSSKQENRGKRTIADLARTVWERNEGKWLVVKDGYPNCKAYEVALRAQFDRNPSSFRLLDDEPTDQSSNL